MKTPVIFFVLLSFNYFLFGQEVSSKSYGKMLKDLLGHTVPEISVPQAAALHETIFIDAREKTEYDVSHIKNAYWSGYTDFNLNRLNGVPKNLQIIVYCSVGYRSEKIAEKLINAGYTNIWNLYGGIFEWKNQGHPVYDNKGNQTEKIHAYDESWSVWLTRGEKVF